MGLDKTHLSPAPGLGLTLKRRTAGAQTLLWMRDDVPDRLCLRHARQYQVQDQVPLLGAGRTAPDLIADEGRAAPERERGEHRAACNNSRGKTREEQGTKSRLDSCGGDTLQSSTRR